ncbi:MAG: ATP-binding protein [bacterium]
MDVSDCGDGISANNRDQIFEAFFTTARTTGGTGLGLSIVRAMARQHGGNLVLLDEKKTTFRLILPVAEPDV